MPYGIKIGGNALFKSYITVTANANTVITVSGRGLTYTQTTNGSGTTTFLIKKKGTYTVTSARGPSASVDVNRSNRTFTANVTFTANITVQTNPNTLVTATGPATYTGTSNSVGVVTIPVQFKGTYTLSVSGASASTYIGSNGATVSVDCVAVTPMSAVTVTGYSTGVATIYWTKGVPYATGVVVKRGGTTLHTGNGSTIVLSTSQSVIGVNATGLSVGTSYSFTVQPYYTVNGRTFYGAIVTRTYTAQDFSGTSLIKTSGTWTVPTGVRSISFAVVGPGGDGGRGNDGGGGGAGGGGYVKIVSLTVTPGQTFSAVIGAVGSDTSFGSYKAGPGHNGSNAGGSDFGTGGKGGSGGGGGGWYDTSSSNKAGGDGGTDGNNANNSTVGTSGQRYAPGPYGETGTTTFNGVSYGNGGGGGGGKTMNSYSSAYYGRGYYGAGHGGGYARVTEVFEYATSGTANTGSGGGGGCQKSGTAYRTPGNGGTGLVAVKY